MRSAFIVPVAAAVALLAGPAAAQDIPRWNLGEACAGESTQAYCIALEAEAYSAVSGIWSTLQPNIREACLGEIKSFNQNSYRLLEFCIEDKLTKLRVTYAREATRADIPDPPKPEPAMPAEVKPAEPAPQSAATEPTAPAPTQPAPSSQQPPAQAAPAIPQEAQPAAPAQPAPPQASATPSTPPAATSEPTAPATQPPAATPAPSEPPAATMTPSEPPKAQ